MENTDSYPCFHTRLVRTQRRRLTRPDGHDTGWLIIDAADQFTEIFEEMTTDVSGTSTSAIDELSAEDDPPQLAIPHPR